MITASNKPMAALLCSIALSVAFFSGPATAEPDIYVNNALIAEIEYGLFCDVVVIGTVDAPETDIGYLKLIDGGIRMISRGTTAPAILGLHFGVKSRAKGDQGLNGVRFHTTHPPFKHNESTTGSFEGSISSERLIHQLYSFDYTYELVTGPWVFEAYKNDQLLYRVGFNVIADSNALDSLDPMCNFPALTS